MPPDAAGLPNPSVVALPPRTAVSSLTGKPFAPELPRLRRLRVLQAPEFDSDWRAAYRLLRGLQSRGAAELDSLEALSDYLYAHWFHASHPHLLQRFPTAAEFLAHCGPAFVLRHATLLRIDAGALEVQPERGPALRLPFGLAHPCPPQAPLRPGCVLRARLLAQAEQGGFWHLWSRPWLESSPARILRCYFAVQPGHEARFARLLAQHAPADAVWYSKFLCGTHPGGRRDSALLYLPLAPTPDWVDMLTEAAAPMLREQPLRLCRRRARGVYCAVDPDNGLSFGQHVAHAVARAALEPGALGSYARFAHPLDAFGSELKALEPTP